MRNLKIPSKNQANRSQKSRLHSKESDYVADIQTMNSALRLVIQKTICRVKIINSDIAGAGDIARENHADGISQVLDDLAKSLGDDNDDKSLDIQPKLAEIITKRWGKKLTPEKIKGLIEKYNRPGNCPLSICKKVNPQI